MKVRLESLNYDKRIFRATIDFTGYPVELHFKEYGPSWNRVLDNEVSNKTLDNFLSTLGLNRIKYWSNNWQDVLSYRYRRYMLYTCVVISDREEHCNDA